MKRIILFLFFLHVLSYSFGQDAFTGLRYAYNSWRINKPLLDKYIAEYQTKVEECKALKIANETEIKRLKEEREKVLQELLDGSFCNQCNRSKSEIEAAEHISFAEHVKNVRGTVIAATPEIVKKRMDEFDDKIRSLSSALTSCEGDAFILKAKVNTYTVYVESNLKSASGHISALNIQLGQDLSIIVQKKNKIASDINNLLKNANAKLDLLNGAENSLQQSNDKYRNMQYKLGESYKLALDKVAQDMGKANGQLQVSSSDSDKTKINANISALNNKKIQVETAYQQALQLLKDNYDTEQKKSKDEVDKSITSFDDLSKSLSENKSKLDDLVSKGTTLRSSFDNDIVFINKTIAEMKLNAFFTIRIADSNQALNRLSSDKIVTASAVTDVTNINNNVSRCLSSIKTVENIRDALMTR